KGDSKPTPVTTPRRLDTLASEFIINGYKRNGSERAVFK
ncbi:MAG: hypothetical protein ACI965_001505, partial [Paraglaciecola sp.]